LIALRGRKVEPHVCAKTREGWVKTSTYNSWVWITPSQAFQELVIAQKQNVPAEVPARLPMSTSGEFGGSGERLTPASRQGEKTTASKYQTRETRADDGTWCSVNVDSARLSWRESYVGNEDGVEKIRGGEVSNRRIVNGKRDSTDLIALTGTGCAFYPETERPE
jgi:hypothetical protein